MINSSFLVLFSNAKFQSPVFLKYHQIFFKKLSCHRFIHIVNVHAATCRVHLCVWSVLLRINKSPLVYFFSLFMFYFFPHPVERSKLCGRALQIWTLNHALHLSLNYLLHQFSIYIHEENNPPTFPSTALYHRGKMIILFV